MRPARPVPRVQARRAGVPLVYAGPAYTGQQCSRCRHIERKNRVGQAAFACRARRCLASADANASRTVAARGETVWTAGRPSPVPSLPPGEEMPRTRQVPGSQPETWLHAPFFRAGELAPLVPEAPGIVGRDR
ncbi:zinc ribbon domain-containing protein [Streptomyces sp. NPDC008121]|uniref:zinc ribbon domain-containing protein n=1 Tax=Streptomyces sp. NPDC008121 TaxID=3364809 RepID=UPI0036E2371D